MNKKTISICIGKKFDKWVNSIMDDSVRELVKRNSIITGGCITSMFSNEPVNDFDIYFTNKETTKAVAIYYTKIFSDFPKNKKCFVVDGDGSICQQIIDNGEEIFKSEILSDNIPKDRIKIFISSSGTAETNQPLGIDEISIEPEIPTILSEYSLNKKSQEEKNKFLPVFLSSNAITLSDKIQLIIRFYGNPREIHKNFDFVHCTNFWTSFDRKLFTNSEALEAILSKQLIYRGSKYPLCSIFRTRKFIKRGWNISAGEYLKMAFQLNLLDLTDVNVLEEQLIGVDTTHFMAIINLIKEQKNKDMEFNIDSCYITKLVDEIF